MKRISILLAVFFACICCKGQILKDLSLRITNDAESKVQQKVSSKIDQSIDSLTKKKGKTKSKDNNPPSTANSADSTVQTSQCGGQIVKMQSSGKDYSMTMELTKAEKKTFPASLFMIPAGYTKSENNILFSNLVHAGQSKSAFTFKINNHEIFCSYIVRGTVIYPLLVFGWNSKDKCENNIQRRFVRVIGE